MANNEKQGFQITLGERNKATNVVLLQERLGVLVRIDKDLGERVVERRVLLSSGDAGLDPGQDELQPVPLLDLVNELIDGEGARDGREQVLDGAFVAVDIEETTDNLGRSGRVDTLDVGLDGRREAVLVEEQDEVVDEIESVADDDERKLIGKLGLFETCKKRQGLASVRRLFTRRTATLTPRAQIRAWSPLTFEEVLDLLRVVNVALPADSLNLSDLTRPRSGDDVLVVNLRVLAEVDDRPEVVVESLKGSVVLEELDELKRSEQLRVFGRDLDDDLKVLTDVDGQHLLEASERLLDSQATKVANQPLGVQEVGVDDNSLDIGEILVVLEGLIRRIAETKRIDISLGVQ